MYYHEARISTDSSSDTRKKPKGFKKILNDNYNSHTPSHNSSILTSMNDEDLFLVYEECHKQPYTLPKTLYDDKSDILISKLDEFLGKEMKKNKMKFNCDLTIEGIIDQITDKDHIYIIVITNCDIYEFLYEEQTQLLTLNRKINLLSIEFLTITSDCKKLILHVNSKLDMNGAYIFTSEKQKDLILQLAFCICNLIFNNYSIVKSVIFIPNSKSIIENTKKIDDLNKYKTSLNTMLKKLYERLNDIIPSDFNEKIIKLVPVNKIETKFIEGKIEKLLIITDKKIIEISNNFDSNIDKTSVNIIPYSKLKGFSLFTKNNKFELLTDDNDNVSIYSSLLSKQICSMIKSAHSKECLHELKIFKL